MGMGSWESGRPYKKTQSSLLFFQKGKKSPKFPFAQYCQDLILLRLTLGILASTEDWPDQSSSEKVEHSNP